MSVKKEYQEAYQACVDVENSIQSALKQLNSAKNWGLFDLFGGGDTITSWVKHSKINKAESLMNDVKYHLSILERELKDVQYSLDGISEFTDMNRVFDIFFDNVFSDWNTQKKIKQNISALEDLNRKISSLRTELEQEMDDLNF